MPFVFAIVPRRCRSVLVVSHALSNAILEPAMRNPGELWIADVGREVCRLAALNLQIIFRVSRNPGGISADAVSFQFSDDGIALITKPTELGGFLVQVRFEILFNDGGDADQLFAFRAEGVMGRQRVPQELRCDRDVPSTIVLRKPGNGRTNRFYEESAKLHGQLKLRLDSFASKRGRFIDGSLRIGQRCRGGEHDRAHGFFEVIVARDGSLHRATVANALAVESGRI
jgi:hypothetical protein